MKDTLTVALEGEAVTLDKFVSAVQTTLRVVDALGRDVAPSTRVQWVVEDLSRSSALVTIRGRSMVGEDEDVELIVAAFGEVATSLSRHQAVARSRAVSNSAGKFLDLIGDDVDSVRLETADVEAVIERSDLLQLHEPSQAASFGAVRGRIQTLSNRGALRFTLFDTLHDKGVSCYLEPDDQELMRDLWGRLVVVEGTVSRDRQGRPRSIRHITEIHRMNEADPERPMRWREAIGAAVPPDDAEGAEVVIRRLRDAQ